MGQQWVGRGLTVPFLLSLLSQHRKLSTTKIQLDKKERNHLVIKCSVDSLWFPLVIDTLDVFDSENRTVNQPNEVTRLYFGSNITI